MHRGSRDAVYGRKSHLGRSGGDISGRKSHLGRPGGDISGRKKDLGRSGGDISGRKNGQPPFYPPISGRKIVQPALSAPISGRKCLQLVFHPQFPVRNVFSDAPFPFFDASSRSTVASPARFPRENGVRDVSLEQFRGLNVVRDEQLKVFRGLNAAAHGARRQLLFAIIAIIVADITIDNTRSQSKFLRTPKSITAR